METGRGTVTKSVGVRNNDRGVDCPAVDFLVTVATPSGWLLTSLPDGGGGGGATASNGTVFVVGGVVPSARQDVVLTFVNVDISVETAVFAAHITSAAGGQHQVVVESSLDRACGAPTPAYNVTARVTKERSPRTVAVSWRACEFALQCCCPCEYEVWRGDLKVGVVGPGQSRFFEDV